MKDVFVKITEYNGQYRQLCHASNIIKKHDDGKKEKQLSLIAEKYLLFLEGNLHLKGYSDDVIVKRVKLLNNYYNFIHSNGFDNIYTSQSKFRPTVLEEFLFLLFKDYVEENQEKLDGGDNLYSGSVKAYSNLFFKAKSFKEFVGNPQLAVNEKDQDYAIYRRFALSINDGQSVCLQVPAVAVEAKTFIDKTMLDGIIATAEKVKNGNPYALFVAVSETYDVSFDVDPAYSQIDQIYVLRKSTRRSAWNDVETDVVLRMFREISSHLERPWSDVGLRLKNEGVIM